MRLGRQGAPRCRGIATDALWPAAGVLMGLMSGRGWCAMDMHWIGSAIVPVSMLVSNEKLAGKDAGYGLGRLHGLGLKERGGGSQDGPGATPAIVKSVEPR